MTGLRRSEISEFRGPIVSPQVEASDIPPDALAEAENVTFGPGYVRTREGHAVFLNPAQPVRSFYHWVTTEAGAESRFVYLRGTELVVRNLVTTAEVSLGTYAGAYEATILPVGNKLYITIRSSTGARIASVVWDGLFVSSEGGPIPMIGNVAAAPPVVSLSVSSIPSASASTKGTHKIGYYVIYASGHASRIVETNTITLTENAIINVTGTMNIPANIVALQYVMTTANNSERYWTVPGSGYLALPPGVNNYPISTSLSTPDSTLTVAGNDVTDKLFQLDSSSFLPRDVSRYGNRLVWCDGGGFYISDAGDYEKVSNDLHRIDLPGRLVCSTSRAIRGLCYLFGPSYTFSVVETGGFPAEWPPPVQVSPGIGTPSPHGVDIDPESGSAFVAAESGLFYFDGGSYPDRPMSYFQTPTWRRINWAYAHLIQVRCHPTEKKVFVAVPFDANTTLSHMLVFDYSRGREPESVRLSIDYISGFTIGCLGLVRSGSSGRMELCIGNHNAGPILRRLRAAEFDANPTGSASDNGSAIYSMIRTGPFPIGVRKVQHRRGEFRVIGSGNAAVSIQSLDRTKTVGLSSLVLDTDPENVQTRRYYMISPRVRYQISTNAVGSYFILSGVSHFWKPWVTATK